MAPRAGGDQLAQAAPPALPAGREEGAAGVPDAPSEAEGAAPEATPEAEAVEGPTPPPAPEGAGEPAGAAEAAPQGAPGAGEGLPASRVPQPARDWKAVRNPVPATPASIKRGQELYEGRGFCHVCHGPRGDGFGPVAGQFKPYPNAFLAPEWQDRFTDGELMGILQEGKFGTGMVPMVPDYLSEEDGWNVINYLRTFRGKTTEAYENFKARQRGEQTGPEQEQGGDGAQQGGEGGN